jgi:hypothetical protein
VGERLVEVALGSRVEKPFDGEERAVDVFPHSDRSTVPAACLPPARAAAEEVKKEFKKAAKGDAGMRLAALMNEEGREGVAAAYEQVCIGVCGRRSHCSALHWQMPACQL